MKEKLTRIAGALIVTGLMYGAVSFASAQDELPVTPPITPSVTVSPTVSPTATPSATPTVTPTGVPSVTPTLTPTTTPTVTPTATPAVSAGHSTGGVWAKSGSDTLKINFNAFSGSPVKGGINFSSSNGNRFDGKVNVCYAQNGNQAVFAGTLGNGNVHNTYFLMRIEDNGEGKKATKPDMVGIWFSDSLPTCTWGDIPSEVTRGNIQVHNH